MFLAAGTPKTRLQRLGACNARCAAATSAASGRCITAVKAKRQADASQAVRNALLATASSVAQHLQMSSDSELRYEKKNSRRHAIKTKNIETHRYHLCLMWNFNEFFMVIEVELGIFEPCFNHAAVKSADSSLALILRCPNSVANDDWEPKLPARHSQPRVSFLAKEHHLTAGDFCYFWCFTTVPPIRRSILERTHVQPGHVEAATGEAHGATDSHLSARLRATCSWCHLALNASPATIQHIPKNGPMPWAKG